MTEKVTFRYVDQAGWVWTITGGPGGGEGIPFLSDEEPEDE